MSEDFLSGHMKGRPVFQKIKTQTKLWKQKVRGAVFVEYLLLLTIIGIGAIAGLTTLRSALINELMDLANAINAINS
ncbi:Flp family type IVb pilin [Gimesia sp.]|uniref:Flp family type IVb pilin n=1 Tax=Gimesia sp. TaxID=2024833 RepID=UPI003A93BCBC